MTKKRFIIRALVAVLAITLGANLDAEAQLGSLINKAKGKGKQTSTETTVVTHPLTIPQPEAGGGTVDLTLKKEVVAVFNKATLEITMKTARGGNTPGTVYKIDPSTGKITDSKGEPKGSISSDGTMESPNLGMLKVQGHHLDCEIFKDGEKIGRYFNAEATTPIGKGTTSFSTNSMVAAYVYFGLLTTERDIVISKLGYDPDQKYTVEELEDLIEWNDEESINKIMQFESSRPYAGFKETHPEFKNCKVGGVGLIEGQWHDGNNWWYIDYWVVYELTDGRNIVTFSTARKKFRYGDVEDRYREIEDRFHEVTDWKRK